MSSKASGIATVVIVGCGNRSRTVVNSGDRTGEQDNHVDVEDDEATAHVLVVLAIVLVELVVVVVSLHFL